MQHVASIPGGSMKTESGHAGVRPAQTAAAAGAPAAAFQAGKISALQAEGSILNAPHTAASEGTWPFGEEAQAVTIGEKHTAAMASAAVEAQCVMCWDASVSVRLAPCGHKCMCRCVGAVPGIRPCVDSVGC